MARLQRKSLNAPDEIREFGHGRLEIMTLDDLDFGRAVFDPGWRWSQDVKPIAGTTWCLYHHVGVVLSGTLHVEGWRELLRQHNERLQYDVDRNRGRLIKWTGDGILALFDGAENAVRCAAIASASARSLGIEIRSGVHTGEVERIPGDVRGVAVHAAARVMALAGPGEVLVSGTTYDLLAGSGLSFDDRGMVELKGLTGPRAIFALRTAETGAGVSGR